MHATNVHPFNVLDALTIIAACSGSSDVIELVTSLRAIAAGELWLPIGPRAEEMARRIGCRMRNQQWVAFAHRVLNDATTSYLVHHFFQWCVRCVPTNAPYPLADETWLPRVRILYSLDPGLRVLAESLLNQFSLSNDNEIAAQNTTTPAQSIAPSAPVPAASKPALSPQAVQALLMTRLRVAAKAKRFLEQFVRHWEAQKARAAVPKPIIRLATTPSSISLAPRPNRIESRTVKPQARRIVQSFAFIPPSSISANATNPDPHMPYASSSFFEVKSYPNGLSPPI